LRQRVGGEGVTTATPCCDRRKNQSGKSGMGREKEWEE
jgi:hypothetical protein